MAGSLRLRLRSGAALGAMTGVLLAPAASLGAPTVTEFGAGVNGPTFETTAGPDGNVWFTEAVGNAIGRITPSGAVTEFTAGVTANSQPLGITAGPDGDVWFTEEVGAKIGRISPSGAVTEFASGITPGSRPADITTGPDGNLWFTEVGGAVARITPSGTVTEFSAGITPNSQPLGIAAGPDGNVWFTESSTGNIGRITPTGTVTEFAIGGAPRGIALGPDGNLWFTDNAPSNRVGRITPAGVVTTFGGLRSFSSLITAGPDGNLWFTEHNADIVASITPSGTITEYSAGISTGAGPFGITTGSDGKIWFGENSRNGVGRLALDQLPPPVFSKTVNLTAKGGTVLVELPGPRRFVPLAAGEQVPVGTVVDTTRGTVQLCSSSPTSQVACSIVYGGQFQITQQGKVSVLVLVGGNFAACPRTIGRAAHLAARRLGAHASVRHLWVDGKGVFRTQGRFASAGVRGTKWLTDDRCDGTLIRVARGAVLVHDLTRSRSFTLKAPRSYLARAH